MLSTEALAEVNKSLSSWRFKCVWRKLLNLCCSSLLNTASLAELHYFQFQFELLNPKCRLGIELLAMSMQLPATELLASLFLRRNREGCRQDPWRYLSKLRIQRGQKRDELSFWTRKNLTVALPAIVVLKGSHLKNRLCLKKLNGGVCWMQPVTLIISLGPVRTKRALDIFGCAASKSQNGIKTREVNR